MAKEKEMSKAEWAKKNARLLRSQGRRYNPKTDEFEIVEKGFVSPEAVKAGAKARKKKKS